MTALTTHKSIGYSSYGCEFGFAPVCTVGRHALSGRFFSIVGNLKIAIESRSHISKTTYDVQTHIGKLKYATQKSKTSNALNAHIDRVSTGYIGAEGASAYADSVDRHGHVHLKCFRTVSSIVARRLYKTYLHYIEKKKMYITSPS